MGKSEAVATSRKKEIVDITDRVNERLSREKVQDGLCHIFALHTTCSITTADLDPGTDLDMLDAFEAIVPKLKYRHPHDPSHAPDHIMSTMLGAGVLVPVTDGELQLGTWQRVVLVELDGPRERQVSLTFLKT